MEANGHSEMFTVRVWREPLDGERWEYRGQVKHLVTGATQHFRDWSDLLSFMASRIEAGRGER